MTERRIYIGSLGPFFYDDTDVYPTPQDAGDQGFGDGVLMNAVVTDGAILADGFKLWDTDETHTLELKWNEDDSANRVFNFLVAGGNRSLTLNEDFTIGDGYNVTITALGQANTLTINEGFTIGNGSAGTLTFSSVCALTVELASVLNQDLTTDAGPTFASCSLGTGELTCGSINRASGTLTLEIGGSTILSIASADVTLADGIGFNLQEDITFTGATTENLIKFPDNLADALSFKNANGDSFLQITSTTGSFGISGGLIKDEDNMASDSAVHLATQQSIRAYTDAAGGTAFATVAVLGTL